MKKERKTIKSEYSSSLTEASEVRCKAEERLQTQTAEQKTVMTLEETQRLVHELKVHQIELEMQNKELLRSREEVELSRNMYAELYDFAPVAYFTINLNGVIREANLAGAQLLGTERGLMLNLPFSRFIADGKGRALFSDHLSVVAQRKCPLKCGITLSGNNGSDIEAELHSVLISNKNHDEYILTSILDASVRKQFEKRLQLSHDTLELTVEERTSDLLRANTQLTHELEERKKAKESLMTAYAEIKRLKERLEAENIYLQEEVNRHYNFGEIIGQSSVISRVFLQVEQVAPMNATVLLLGETGTGKGVVARAIHSCSTRKGQPLITVNCTTLPATLVESELFGRERGAFTGSDARQIGRFELANGGTIFLDEIGEMPLYLQSKLLRVIQDGEFERLGNPRTIKTDVRIIAASNRNLAEEVKNGTFREDLYYRLNVFPITLPPLRMRKDDIPLLVNHFITKFNKKIGKKIESVSKETLNALHEYYWPGNVRELESIIERAIIISKGSNLQILDSFDKSCKPDEPTREETNSLIELERDHILRVLQKVSWRIEGKNGAALLLGLNASTLRARMRKYGIVRT